MPGSASSKRRADVRGALRWLMLLLSIPFAVAHEGAATGFASIEIERNVIRYTLTLSALPVVVARGADGDVYRPAVDLLAAMRERLQLTADGAPCMAASGRLLPAPAAVSVTGQVDFVCRDSPAELFIRDDLYEVLGADLHVLARASFAEGSVEHAFATDSRVWRIPIAGAHAEPPAIGGYLVHGVEHILIGYDHLLFLLALLLRAGRLREVVKIVTAFTAAHSLTLALSALGYVQLPPMLVEAAIAGSIAYVAAENLLAAGVASRRWQVSFLFGLVHGFGFSSVLGGIGLPQDLLLSALFSFNLGVEAGQLLVVTLAWPLLVWLARRPWHAVVVTALSGAMVVAGLGLLAVRLVPAA